MKSLSKSNGNFARPFFLISLTTVLSINVLRIMQALRDKEGVFEAVRDLFIALGVWFLILIIYRAVRSKK